MLFWHENAQKCVFLAWQTLQMSNFSVNMLHRTQFNYSVTAAFLFDLDCHSASTERLVQDVANGEVVVPDLGCRTNLETKEEYMEKTLRLHACIISKNCRRT